MFILLMEFNLSTEGIWKQITHGYAAASQAFWLATQLWVQLTAAAVNTNVSKWNVYLVQLLLQMGFFS